MLPALDSSRDRMSSDHDPPPGSCCCSYAGSYVDMQLDILLLERVHGDKQIIIDNE